MPSIETFGQKYATQLREDHLSPSGIQRVINAIRGIQYTSSGEPLSNQDVDTLLNAIEQELRTPLTKEGRVIKEAEDSRKIIQVIKMIRNGVKEK